MLGNLKPVDWKILQKNLLLKYVFLINFGTDATSNRAFDNLSEALLYLGKKFGKNEFEKSKKFGSKMNVK